ncbi:hypothetical protein OF83DRAFT_127791 [Amylostereum chailletii]|nr:hypothetical protein OF83DRAFT_127791 [Amylostereum chailletii]
MLLLVVALWSILRNQPVRSTKYLSTLSPSRFSESGSMVNILGHRTALWSILSEVLGPTDPASMMLFPNEGASSERDESGAIHGPSTLWRASVWEMRKRCLTTFFCPRRIPSLGTNVHRKKLDARLSDYEASRIRPSLRWAPTSTGTDFICSISVLQVPLLAVLSESYRKVQQL